MKGQGGSRVKSKPQGILMIKKFRTSEISTSASEINSVIPKAESVTNLTKMSQVAE